MGMEYEARVEQVTSGDDLYLMVSVGFDDLYKRVRVRLAGVDTPDAYMKPSDSPANKVRKEVAARIKDKYIRVEIVTLRSNSWSVVLFYSDKKGAKETNLNQELIAQGYIYHGRKTQ